MVTRIGPEQPTIAERFVRLLHVPYLLGCVIWALVLLEIPILFARFYGSHEPITNQQILYLIVVFLMSVYFPMSVRFVRNRLLEAEPKITPLLPDGEADYHGLFGRAVNPRRQIIVIIVIALMAIYVIIHTSSFVGRVINSVCSIYIAVMLGSLIWFNIGCVTGLYRLGGKSLKFRSFWEGPKLGTRPIGSLCLSLSAAYFVGVILLILFSVTSPNELYQIPYIRVIYGVFILGGLTMFFLPLYRVHLRMAEEKARQELQVQRQFDMASNIPKSNEKQILSDNIQKLMALEMVDRKIQAISTWPFDTGLLTRLLIILLPVIASLFAHYLTDLLR